MLMKSVPGSNCLNTMHDCWVRGEKSKQKNIGYPLSAWEHCIVKRQEIIFPWKTIWSNLRCGCLGRRLFSLARMIKVLAAERSWLSPVAQHLYTDKDSHVPSAVSRKMLLNSCSRNPEKAVPEWFNLPHYHALKGWNCKRGKRMQSALYNSSCYKIRIWLWNPLESCLTLETEYCDQRTVS